MSEEMEYMPITVPGLILGVPKGKVAMLKDYKAIPLPCVSEEDLARLCDDFRANVFKTAGKIDPEKGIK